MNRKRPISMARPMVRLYQGVLALMPGEGAAVVARAARVGVKDLAEAVRAVVVHVGGGRPGGVPVAVLGEREPRH